MSFHRVACRALVLAAVVCRGFIEAEAKNPETVALQARLLEWITKSDLWDEAEPHEAKLLRTPIGGLTPNEVVKVTWCVEGLAILAWALGQMEIPPHDQMINPNDAADAVYFLRDDAAELIRASLMRNVEELSAAREFFYALHSRLSDFLRNAGSKDFSRWIEKSWIHTLRLDAARLFVDNDLALDDRPISEAKNERVQECAHIAYQRHKASIWLLGRYPVYSETPADV